MCRYENEESDDLYAETNGSVGGIHIVPSMLAAPVTMLDGIHTTMTTLTRLRSSTSLLLNTSNCLACPKACSLSISHSSTPYIFLTLFVLTPDGRVSNILCSLSKVPLLGLLLGTALFLGRPRSKMDCSDSLRLCVGTDLAVEELESD